MVTIDNNRMKVRFDRFGLEEYALFLRLKKIPEQSCEFDPETESYTISAPARYAKMLGVERPKAGGGELPIADYLFDDQKVIVPMALDAKKFACWSNCGLGKTAVFLEWGRHVVHRTGGRVLITTVNEVIQQTIDEAQRFYNGSLPVLRLTSREHMKHWMQHGAPGLGIVNYEKWNPPSPAEQVVIEAAYLAGIVCDEGHRLNTAGGKQKWALIKSCEQIECRLITTATPAPNDWHEFMSQAGFLGRFTSEHSILTYFSRDTKSHRWTVKRHAQEDFFRFLASWSIYLQNPKRFGWRLDQPDVPEPEYLIHKLDPLPEQMAAARQFAVTPNGQRLLWQEDTNAIQRQKLSQIAKGFYYLKGQGGKHKTVPSLKPGFVADLVRDEAKAGLQVLVWTIFDAETTILSQLLQERGVSFEMITGKTSDDDRIATIERFRRGELPVLVSRAQMLGFGLNFQCCGSMVFNGFDDSFVKLYQAVRRAYRHGQTKRVRVHIPVIPDLEGDMWDNLCVKQKRNDYAASVMEDNYLAALREMGVINVAA